MKSGKLIVVFAVAFCGCCVLPAADFVVEVGWRVRLKDGTMVSAATASQRGLEVEAEVKSAADGSFVCGPLRLGGVRRGDVEAVCWPSVTLRVGPGAKALYSEVFGAQGNLRMLNVAGKKPGTRLFGCRNSPGFRFGAVIGANGESVYLDSRETDCSPVKLVFSTGMQKGEVVMEAEHGAASFPAGGVVRPFKGGWFAAAKIYREWALKQRRAVAARGRDLSRLREISMWFWNRGLSEDVIPPVERFKKDSGVPVALDWYWWHAIPYDSGHPDFWPPREGVEPFRAAVKRLVAAGIYSQVYMNGMTWDMDGSTWRGEGELDAVFPLKATAYNVYDRHRLANLCGESPRFQTRMEENVRKLAESGLDGIYLDMISCASQEAVCFNPRHSHRPGDGAAQANGWRDFLKKLKAAHPGLALSSEDAGESYLDLFDSLICCFPSYERIGFGTGPAVECVPVFNAVYHGLVATFGSYAMIDGIPPWDPRWPDERRWKKEREWERLFPDQFAVELARGTVWGMQPTVHNFRLSAADDPRYAADYTFMVDTARFHYANRDLLFDGEMRDPGTMECAKMKVDFLVRGVYATEGSYRVATEPALPAVFHSVWRAPDGRTAAVLVNWTHEPQAWKLRTPDVSGEGTLPPRTWMRKPVAER